ncbi:hypothetical protein CesoFtcFv8_010642 [Champsocephalus esox]|uniref:Uncharacterized protein n=1 Tax=Champsocephalus esox TaxID=159716 RepID=A0AAN8H0C9_9TELE|nr:hypothetical protein CesoFtcFv8_010642 [Champsocephalus esox]
MEKQKGRGKREKRRHPNYEAGRRKCHGGHTEETSFGTEAATQPPEEHIGEKLPSLLDQVRELKDKAHQPRNIQDGSQGNATMGAQTNAWRRLDAKKQLDPNIVAKYVQEKHSDFTFKDVTNVMRTKLNNESKNRAIQSERTFSGAAWGFPWRLTCCCLEFPVGFPSLQLF